MDVPEPSLGRDRGLGAQSRPDVDNAPLTGILDQSFPKGVAFSRWLEIVGAQSGPGQIQINVPRHSLNAVVAPTQRWISTTNPTTVQHLTFNAPLGVPEANQCGRVLFSDFHVTALNTGDELPTTGPLPVFPTACTDTPLSPQEKVLEFMLFDLASCIQPVVPPAPPPPPPARPPRGSPEAARAAPRSTAGSPGSAADAAAAAADCALTFVASVSAPGGKSEISGTTGCCDLKASERGDRERDGLYFSPKAPFCLAKVGRKGSQWQEQQGRRA